MNRQRRRQLAQDLGVDHRDLPKGPDVSPIAIPEQEGVPHGQFMMSNGALINFIEDPWEGDESIRRMARRVDEFLRGDEAIFEFMAPHDGKMHVFSRIGALGIVGYQHARAKGPVAPEATGHKGKIIRVDGSLPPELLGKS